MGEMFQVTIPMKNDLANLQLPDIDLLNDWKLAENRIFYIDYEIGVDILDIQRQIIAINLDDNDNRIPIEKRKPIILMLDCPGGLLAETMSLATIIHNSKTPVWTVNMVEASSGGAILLMAGQKRFAMSYSTALIHTGSGGLGGTYEQTQAQAKKYEKEVEVMGDFILNNTSIDRKLYNKNKAKDWYMDAEEQLKYGLVDEVVSDVFSILCN